MMSQEMLAQNTYTKKTNRITLKFFCVLFLIFSNIAGYCLINSLLRQTMVSFIEVKSATWISLSLITAESLLSFIFNRKRLTSYSIFIISFVLFHFGQFFIYSIGATYNFFYLEQYNARLVIKAIQLEYVAVGSLLLAGFFSENWQPFSFCKANNLEEKSICRVAKIAVIVTGFVSFILLAGKSFAFVRGNYEGARSFDASVPSVIGIFEYFYAPFSILFLVYSKQKREKDFVSALLFVWGVITAICGDRTSGIAAILIVFLLKSQFKKEKKIKKLISGMIVLVLTIFLISFIRYFREGKEYSFNGFLSALFDVLGELGGSFFPVVLIIKVCPSNHSFLYGKTYFYSLLAGLIPESLDFTGTITAWTTNATLPLGWISRDYDYTFGTGYSLVAEAYANFGEFGWIVLFLTGVLVAKLLKQTKKNHFSQYVSMVLLFEFFTVARRNFYYIINHTFYCVIIVYFLLLLLCKKKGTQGYIDGTKIEDL